MSNFSRRYVDRRCFCGARRAEMFSLKVNLIPSTATNRDLKQFFNHHLEGYFEHHPEHHIGDVHIPRERGRISGYAFVRFCSREAAVEAEMRTDGRRLFCDGMFSNVSVHRAEFPPR